MENTDSTTQQSVLNYQCYSYVSIFEKLQPLLKDGYRFDLESNAGFPQNFGTVFTFTVIKDEGKPEVKSAEALIYPGGGLADETVDTFTKISSVENKDVFSKESAIIAFENVKPDVVQVKPEGTRRSKQRG